MASLTPEKTIKIVNAIAEFLGEGKPVGIGHNKPPVKTPLETWMKLHSTDPNKVQNVRGLGIPKPKSEVPTSIESAGFPVKRGESGPGPEIPQKELDDPLIQQLLDENPELVQTLDKIIEENPLVANMDTAAQVQMAREQLEMNAMKRLETLQNIPPSKANILKKRSDIQKEIEGITQEDASRLPESMGGRTASREITGNIDDDFGMQATSYGAGIADPKDLQKQLKGEPGQDYLRQVEADFEGRGPSRYFDETGQGSFPFDKPRSLEGWEKKANIERLKSKPGVTEKEITEAQMGTWGPEGSPKVKTEKFDRAYQDLNQRMVSHENNLDSIETTLTNPQALRILAEDAGQRQIIDRALKDSFDEIKDIEGLLKTFESRVTKGKTFLGKTGTASFFKELESTKARVKALRRELQQAGKLSGRQTALGQTPETADILRRSKGGARLVPEADRDALKSIQSFSEGGYPNPNLWKQLTKDRKPDFPVGGMGTTTKTSRGEVVETRAPTAKEMAETTEQMDTVKKLQSMLEEMEYGKVTKTDADRIALIRIFKEIIEEGGGGGGLLGEQANQLLEAIKTRSGGKSIPLSNFQEMLEEGGRAFNPENLDDPSLWQELID